MRRDKIASNRRYEMDEKFKASQPHNSRLQIPDLLIFRKLTISNSLNENTKMAKSWVCFDENWQQIKMHVQLKVLK